MKGTKEIVESSTVNLDNILLSLHGNIVNIETRVK